MRILYKDDYLVAINKPSGLLVHRSMIDRHETQFALQLVRDMIGQHVFPVHRLDKPTSGVLLFALSSDVARDMSKLYAENVVEKKYLAIVRGYTDETGCIDYALKEELDKMTDAKANQDKPAQDAITNYRCLAKIELPLATGRYETSRYSLLLVAPKTGRKHQIRRHLKHIFHPIVGDTTHGDGKHNATFRRHFNCHRLMLHAWQVRFKHPISGNEQEITADPDETFESVLKHFNWLGAVNAQTIL